jgi:D-3-phosphoglycerate dehydrogenase
VAKDKIVILDSGYDSYAYEEELFRNAGYQLEIFPGKRHDREGKKQFAKEAKGLFVRWTEINDDFLHAIPQLKAIVRYGVGYDNVDIAAASRQNIKVSNVQGYANHAVSDHAIALIYACVRALPQGEKFEKKNFTKPPIKDIPEIHTLTLGIIGLGRIGGTLCIKAKPLFNEILACDPYIPDERFKSLGATKSSLENLIEQSDVISLHCNLTEETNNLINERIFGLMGRHPILINTSRGPVVNEEDLLKGLNEGRLHSAGLDVFHEEPPTESCDELLSHPRVITTGHYAWYSTTSTQVLQQRAADNLLSMLRDELPKDCLNPD